MLEIQDLSTYYGSIRALSKVSLSVAQGEVVALIGANGAGKSTLLKTVCGLLKPKQGKIVFDGSDVTALGPETIVRRGLSLVPERRQVFAPLSVHDNLLLGAYSRLPLSRNYIDHDTSEMFHLFPILEKRQDQMAGTLSGGEQQMLAIARALMSRPRLLLLDEPSVGLAPLIVREILRIVAELRRGGTTILLVEQNARAALGIADRAYVLDNGEITLSGCSADLARNPDVQRAYLGKANGAR